MIKESPYTRTVFLTTPFSFAPVQGHSLQSLKEQPAGGGTLATGRHFIIELTLQNTPCTHTHTLRTAQDSSWPIFSLNLRGRKLSLTLTNIVLALPEVEGQTHRCVWGSGAKTAKPLRQARGQITQQRPTSPLSFCESLRELPTFPTTVGSKQPLASPRVTHRPLRSVFASITDTSQTRQVSEMEDIKGLRGVLGGDAANLWGGKKRQILARMNKYTNKQGGL